MSAKEQQIAKMKDLMWKTLLKLERMKVNPTDVLDELTEKYNNTTNPDEQKSKILNADISLLVKKKPGVWGWCNKGHELSDMSLYGSKWDDDKCVGCGSNVGKIFECESCMNFDKNINKNAFDDTLAKYLWCNKCGTENNPVKVQKALDRNAKIQEQVYKILKNNPQIAIDLLTGLKNKNSLVRLLNEICVDKNKSRYALYLFDIDGFKQLNEKYGHDGADQLLKAVGKILDNFEQQNIGTDDSKDDFGTQLAIERCWCFRPGGDEFAIVTEQHGRTPIFKQEQFYNALKKQINDVDIYVSIGMCCMGFGSYPSPGAEFKSAEVWLAYADKALYQAKNEGKNSIRLYDHNQKQILKKFR